MNVTVAHTPDADDAFMFYGLASGKINTEGFEFEHIVNDIHSLNLDALNSKWDISAISFAIYPLIYKRYQLLPCGASVGDGYGPVVVAKAGSTFENLASRKIGIPGITTSAYLVLLHYLKADEPQNAVEMEFTEIPSRVLAGSIDAGLLIHEAQITYREMNLELVVDLGDWWKKEFGIPLPLGGNVIRRTLPEEIKRKLALLLRKSIEFSLSNPTEAMAYAMEYSRGINANKIQSFVSLYVNENSLNLKPEVVRALKILFSKSNVAFGKKLQEIEIDPVQID